MQDLAQSTGFQHSSVMVLSKAQGLSSGPVSMNFYYYLFSVVTQVLDVSSRGVILVNPMDMDIVLFPFPC